MDQQIDDVNDADWHQAQTDEHQQYEEILSSDPGYFEWLKNTRL